jgi:hypothetical protein
MFHFLNVVESADADDSACEFLAYMDSECRSQWPRVLRRRSAAACLLR